MRRVNLCVAIGVCCALAAGPVWGTTITGTVRLTSNTVSQKKLPVTIDQYICGEEKAAEGLVLSADRGIRNAVAFLENPPLAANGKGPVTTVQIDQKECVFVPHVVVVPVGGSVEFVNSDRLLHNVKSFSKANTPFNKAQPKSRILRFVFRKPEIIRIGCELHSWMSAWIVVTAHPFYAVTNERGEFILENVPPGTYTLHVWQETLGTVTTEVRVDGSGTSTVEVEMTQK